MRLRPLALLLAALLALAACSDDATDEPVVLTRSGGCGDAYLWAATEDGNVAIALALEAGDRSTTEPTTTAVDLASDPLPLAELQRGDGDVASTFCVDVIDGDDEPDETIPLVAGTGEITLDPATDQSDASCGEVEGSAQLRDLEAEDGTTFAPVTIETTGIGCYAG